MWNVRVHVAGMILLGVVACGSDYNRSFRSNTIASILQRAHFSAGDEALSKHLWFTPVLSPGVRLNHIQVRGTHNSYHVQPRVAFAPEHAYTHRPLYEQLDRQGIHALELDIHLEKGRLAVYHISMLDPLTHCYWLSECLRDINRWSDRNQNHLPLMIWVEIKDFTGGDTITDLDIVDQAILAGLPHQKLITPEKIQGEYPSLRDALATDQWPEVDTMRGKMMFLMVNGDEYQRKYTHFHTTIQDRVMFANAEPEQFDMPWAAVSKINDPTDVSSISSAHQKYILVASNVCTSNQEDRECYERLSSGWQNGVHMLMDDFPAPVIDRVYWQEVPGTHNAWCNPVTAASNCNDANIAPMFELGTR